MSEHDQLNSPIEDVHEENVEAAMVNGIRYLRDDEGTWRYADSWLKVPGGRDLTLTERFQPKLVIASSGGSASRIERVVISGEDISANPELLGWCLDHGFSVQGPDGEVVEVMIPFEIWSDRDRIPGEIYAPAHHGSPAERELAEAERRYREADRALENAAARRAEVLRRYSDEMTRQQARLITDLSVGRIQQLIREGDEDPLDEVDRHLLTVIEAKKLKGQAAVIQAAEEVVGTVLSDDLAQRRLQSLRDRGLIKRVSGAFRITPEGRAALIGRHPEPLGPVSGDP